MAIVYQKTASDKCIILGTREAFLRPFTSSWTKCRIGGFFSITNSSDSNTNPGANETVNVTTVYDRIFFGLKNCVNFNPTTGVWTSPSTEPLPGQAGSKFIGISNYSGGGSVQNIFYSPATYCNIGGSDYEPYFGYANGASLNFATNVANPKIMYNDTSSSATNYGQFHGIQFEKTGGNLVTTTYFGTATNPINDFSDTSLYQWLTYVSYPGGVESRNATIADPFPSESLNGFFFRWPMWNSRIRIHNYGAVILAV